MGLTRPRGSLLALAVLAATVSAAGAPVRLESYSKVPLAFEPNRGQAGRGVAYLTHAPGYSLLLERGEIVLASERRLDGAAVRIQLVGADLNTRIRALDPLEGCSNYFFGRDPNRWLVGIPTYARVRYEHVYRGIDLVFYGDQRQLEYDWMVAPGADPGAIRIGFHGARRLRLTPAGDLVIETAAGELVQPAPVAYQETTAGRRMIPACYFLSGRREVAFALGSYDRSRALVIDPILRYATLLGGSDADVASGVAADAAGNAYVVGTTSSRNFPTANPVQPAFGGSKEVFVTKLNAAGSAVAYSTYIGGSGDDIGAGIAVDAAGNAYITGNTLSSNFATTPAALQPSFAGGAALSLGDAFVAKLDPNGALVYSTYLGGSGDDAGFGIAIDSSGSAYVTGITSSTSFPVTAGAFRIFLSGSSDAFVAKLNPAGSSLSYSTFLGGADADQAAAIAVDSSGSAYVTGSTSSSPFPTVNALQPSCAPSMTPFTQPCADAFVAKLNPPGSALVYSTYLGGRGLDSGRAIAVDASGAAFVAGVTDSGNFPVTAGAFQPVFGGGPVGDGFVARLNAAGSALLYSTFLGGNGDDVPSGIAVDGSGNAYVAGFTSSTNFPTFSPLQASCATPGGAACADAFIARLNTTGSSLLFSTYFGGSGLDRARGVALDAFGSAYVAGESQSADFPASAGAFQTSFGGASDAFVLKLGESNPAPVLASLAPSTAQAGAPGLTLTATGSGFVPGSTVRWNGSDRLTTFVNTTQLTAAIPAGDIAAVGSAQIAVFNPPPGGGVSNALTFTIAGNPAPVINALLPASARAGDDAFTLNIFGNGFIATSVARWNGSDRPTRFLDSGRLQASISAADVAATGTAQVTVFSPAPVGGLSNVFEFRIDNPAPLINSLSPPSAPIGGPGFTLTVNGSRFVPGSVVRWNGDTRPTVFVSSSQVQASIPAGDLVGAGAAQITVFNPGPGGGSSSVVAFTITRAPIISTGGVVNAATFANQPVAVGAIGVVFGSNLAPSEAQAASTPLPTALGGAIVRLDGIAAPLFFVSPFQINFLVPWELAGRSQASMTVETGGVTSAAQPANLTTYAPAVFTTNQRGTGQGAILIAGTGVLAAPAGMFPGSRPVSRGAFVEIYGIGFGPVTNQPATGAPAAGDPLSATTAAPTVTMGGVPASVAFAGLTPSLVGLYQINAQVPDNAPTGPAVSVIVTAAGINSNTVTMAVQ